MVELFYTSVNNVKAVIFPQQLNMLVDNTIISRLSLVRFKFLKVSVLRFRFSFL